MKMRSALWKALLKLQSALAILKTMFFYRLFFRSIGDRSAIYPPTLLANPQYISIGSRVIIRSGVRLEVVNDGVNENPTLQIGSDTNIEQNVHIVCHCRVIVGSHVSITANCAIVDVKHPYKDIKDPTGIGSRIDNAPSYVEIGDYCFLGVGAIVLPNVKLGRHCVVGANTVVTQSFPDYSVIAGTPARLLRQFRPDQGTWVSITENSCPLNQR